MHLADRTEPIFARLGEPGLAQLVNVVAEDSDDAMIVARDADDIAVTGAGRIVAGGEAFHDGFDETTGVLKMFARRPRVLVPDRCRKVRLEGFRTERSPMWALHLVDCDDVTVGAHRL
ncbi:MAG: hypothetical protein INR68_19500, partial [Methylobacterium mesophilicum]|nr:hypothetical protein [Methylobacterium mesophilicum]